jgi:energy-coupling factor transporter ATP-binding protein EcfA2
MKKLKKKSLPKITNRIVELKNTNDFPVDYFSASSLCKFSTSPLMFKVRYINHDHIESANGTPAINGKAFHTAMQFYYNAIKEKEKDPIKIGLEEGMKYLEAYEDNYIDFSSTVPSKQKMLEIYSFTFNSYLKDKKHDNVEVIETEKEIHLTVDVDHHGQRLIFPVALRGFIDKVIRHKKGRGAGRISVIDYKTCKSFSNPEKIDGAKIIQAIQYYFMAYMEYGEKPYSMIYEEVKTSKNSGKNLGQPQLKEYEIIYEDNEPFFEFYFRFYSDVIRAINGEAVFVPNINDFYDNEIAILAYIYRLDEPEERAKQMKKLKVDNITDLLKKKIQNAGNMRKLLKTAEDAFTTAKSINYKDMKIEEKIKAKLMEHGMILDFAGKISGNSVDLYQYAPTIGLKMSKLRGYTADIEQVVGVAGVRVLAPIPNTSLVGFEVPRKDRIFVERKAVADGFNLAMGINLLGEEHRFDIRRAPHLLIAGATGSGKSVFLNSLISQLSENKEVELHLFDPKLVELAQFRGIAKQYYTDTEDIYLALEDLVSEMSKRYKLLSDAGVRNIEEYKGEMKYKVIVIDEFGDLVLSGNVSSTKVSTGEKYKSGEKKGEYKTKNENLDLSKEISKDVLILAQKARACGIHLIIATQRPSVDIITGSIKANFPTKVAFRTAKETDSRVLLDEAGAEKLLGKGDMLFSSDEGQVRLQGFNF